MQQVSRSINDVAVLELSGRFDSHAAPAVSAWMDSVTGRQPARVVVNLSGVHFIDSAALSALVSGMKRCRTGKGELYLCCLQQPVRIIFELTRLNRAFTIFDEEAIAVAMLTDRTIS
ncbi:MAG: STAS domain-containing protein [Chloroflexales bacterium]